MTKEDKNIILNLIKNLDLKEKVIEDKTNQKWYKFGAFDSLQLLAIEVEGLKETK
jgi:hypothetical protein